MKIFNWHTFLFLISCCLIFTCKNNGQTQSSSPPPPPTSSANSISGYYFYMADVGLFYPCNSPEKPMPVTKEKGNLELEKKYLQLFENTPEKVFLKCEGRITSRPKMEGNGKEKCLLVEKVIELNKDKKCP